MEELMNTGSTVITYTDYHTYKADLDAELQKTAESFIRIGYLLKVARDTGILEKSGYANVNEFAQKEYGLDKTQVSRFIRINDRFSEDGYAEHLKEEYRGFGYAKLAIMLQLPESLTEELTPEYSKSEIQAIKEECDEETKVSDLEVMMEQKDERQQELDSMLAQSVYQIGKDNAKLYCEIWESQMERGEGTKELIEILAPAGVKTYFTRISGKGRMILWIKTSEGVVKLSSLRDETEKRTYTQDELLEAFRTLLIVGSAKESWESTYGDTFPEEKEEVAPVQQIQRKESKVAKAPETKKESKKEPVVQQSQEVKLMTLHEVEESIPEPSPMPQEEPVEEVEDTRPGQEEQLPGQDSIENHPEYMPEEPEKAETLNETAEQQSQKNEEESKCRELQDRATQILEMSLLFSIDMWKGKVMPLETVRLNKNNAKRIMELFEEMERLYEAENEE